MKLIKEKKKRKTERSRAYRYASNNFLATVLNVLSGQRRVFNFKHE